MQQSNGNEPNPEESMNHSGKNIVTDAAKPAIDPETGGTKSIKDPETGGTRPEIDPETGGTN